MKDSVLSVCVVLGLLLIGVGILIPIFMMDIHSDVFRYLYASGALLLLVGRLFNDNDVSDARLKRLYRIECWAAIFFFVAAVFMFYDRTNLRDPMAFTLAGAIIQVYTSIMIPRALKK